MFTAAIERANGFTRPIHIITRLFGSTDVFPGAGTLFFVNAQGWALTCKHVVEHLAATDQVRARYQQFKLQRAAIPADANEASSLAALKLQYGYADTSAVEILNLFVNCVEGQLDIEARMHGSLDVALLHFRNFTRLLCTTFPTFASNGGLLKQGKFLCRLGFPFPEFTNFEYDSAADEIRWTNTGRQSTAAFPIEGMVTRHIIDQSSQVIGAEISTPGLRGQSGGPAFDFDGRVWGMQAATNHLDLDFDVDLDVLRGGKKQRVKDSAFLHVGHCVHVDILKQFMRDNGVGFQEG